tara:strand:- start:1114 stop:1293 length:180 start_codon:yes stop_codon:yes gene_type:complete
MSLNTYTWLKKDKFYVRVYLKGPKNDSYHTLGPYEEEKAKSLNKKYLSEGICSWIEKVD